MRFSQLICGARSTYTAASTVNRVVSAGTRVALGLCTEEMAMTKMKLAIVLCGCLLGGVAVAAPKWDANGDGAVSAEEKTLKHEEMKAKRAEMKAQMLAKFDTNKDGKLDQAERGVMKDARATEAFKRLDADGNGSISLTEFKAGKHFKGGHHFGGRRGGMKVR
jgi:hypothetical protein